MFTLFKRNKITPSEIIENISTDINSHLIDSKDSLEKNINETLDIVTQMRDLGYKKIVVTPNIAIDSCDSENDILNRFTHLKREIEKRSIDIELDIAAVYYVDEGFLNQLKSKPLTVNDEFLLFKTSYTIKPTNLDDIVKEIQYLGFKPILAHPERYAYIKKLAKDYYNLKNSGLYFQIDLNSIGSFYGKSACKKIKFLAENGLVDFVGSHIHSIREIESIKDSLTESSFWYTLFEKNRILNKQI